MGLAAPRKRTKLSHDPRNLAWSNADGSYGQRLMQSQGWSAGQALGAKGRKYEDTQAATLKVSVKDDTLGLGASLKSKDVANQRTGFDAFQGLLGRLNAKDEAELKVVEKKIEDKKLAAFAQGRWGGMVFVPGGILVQSDPFKQKVEAEQEKTEEKSGEADGQMSTEVPMDKAADKAARRAEKQKRKEERKLRKEQKLSKKSQQTEAEVGLPTPDSSSGNEASTKKKTMKSKKRARSPEPAAEIVIQPQARHGRQLLRGKNILAKRAAFADMKGLDEIFMKVG